MPEERRRLFDMALDRDTLVGGIVEEVRRGTRRRIVDHVLDGTVRDRVDEILGRARRR
jgi:hypothetical protein